jgi:conjugative relaxase-like TrwC/TraI family protein
MTLHKLYAGNGYTYLTRQVAANDVTETRYGGLSEYYTERGESSGVWLGNGLGGLERGPTSGDRVHEAQMVALFGQGRHPNADAIEQAVLAAGDSPESAVQASALGRPFNIRSGSTEFRQELARRAADHNRYHGRRAGAAIDPEVAAALRTQLGREWFTRDSGREPADSRELTDYVTSAARSGAHPVAGYDLTFSPVKSVSALWALAGPEVAAEVAAAHQAAVGDVVRWLERTSVYTRLGHNGTQQVDVLGLIAVAFTHRDSRAGDPDLHTHVAVSNKVQTLDRRWLALDGRPLHRAAVAASERYNTRLEAQLAARLGVRFVEQPSDDGKRPIREIYGVDPALLELWSKRRSAILAREEQLAAEFSRAHGRAPDFGEETRLFDRANTDTRRRKHAPRSESDQRQEWRHEAVTVLGGEGQVATMLDRVGAAPRPQPAAQRTGQLDEPWIERAAYAAIAKVSAHHSTWVADVVRAEVERQARYGGVPLADVDDVVEATLAVALSDNVSVRLGPGEPLDEPVGLRRLDGTSVFSVCGSQLFTSMAVLEAEARILEAATWRDGRVLDEGTIELALLEARANGTVLNDQQAHLVRSLGTSGRRVQLAMAPAGSGKTTALGVLARAWADAGGDVIGLAPMGRTAAQLRQTIMTTTDTVDKLLFTLNNGTGPAWVGAISERTLVLLDEAGAVGTPKLDRLIAYVTGRGASVCLIGDIKQLGRPESGGVLRDIAETIGAAGLDTLMRFDDPVEGHASLGLRMGDRVALGYYLDHDRVRGGDRSSMIEQALTSWSADRAAGKDSLLLAQTNRLVRQLNTSARALRLVSVPQTGSEVRLHDGACAGAGDTVVTRSNRRRLVISATDWVKNGDRWLVEAVNADGGLRVIHADTHRHITLPAGYVVVTSSSAMR